MALNRPKLLVAESHSPRNLSQTQRTSLFSVYDTDNGELLWTLRMPRPDLGGPPPYRSVQRYNMHINNDRIIISMLTGTDITAKKPSAFVYMHDLTDTANGSGWKWGQERGRVLIKHQGQFRRTRFPAIFVEKDSLFVGDENGRDILELSYWKVKTKRNKQKNSLPRWI